MLTTKNSKNELLYQSLKKDILELKYQPGEKISEAQIAQLYNTSRAPVRDAITRLQQEGLILVEPQVGSYIAEISLKKLHDMLQVRLALEPIAAKTAIPRISPEELMPLRKEIEGIKRLAPERQIEAQKQIDQKIHLLLLDRCGNEYVTKFGREMLLQSQWVQLYTTLHTATRRLESLKETDSILAAIEEANSEKVCKTIINHLENILCAFDQSVKLIDKG